MHIELNKKAIGKTNPVFCGIPHTTAGQMEGKRHPTKISKRRHLIPGQGQQWKWQ